MQPKELPCGRVYKWSLKYEPSGDGGRGRVTATLDGDEASYDLSPGHKADGAEFDHFGVLNVMKQFDRGAFGTLWVKASAAIHEAQHIIFIGYSLPATDLHSTALFRTSVKREHLKALIVVNRDPDARRRTRSVLQRGLTPDTRVLSFASLPEFLAVERKVWEV